MEEYAKHPVNPGLVSGLPSTVETLRKEDERVE